MKIGLLATEAGTLGRVVGDMLIAAVGARDSGATFVNNLFVPLFVGMFSTLLCIYFLYDRLET